MDIGLLKAFLEIARTRHFGRAAENLFLTQSAISARIKLLEDQLNVKLFTRDRKNIQLTAAGTRFLPYAENLVNTWNKARLAVGLAEENQVLLSVGVTSSLWDIRLNKWAKRVYQAIPDIALNVEELSGSVLSKKLSQRELDLGFSFEHRDDPALSVKNIGQVDLIMFSTHRDYSVQAAIKSRDYILVDWGTFFASAHAQYFPDIPTPSVRMGLGRMALSFMLDHGGTAYLAEPMVTDWIEQGRIFPVTDAPMITRQIFACYSPLSEKAALIERALELL
jgi:DNA-binding transcriptional LysR family regulator